MQTLAIQYRLVDWKEAPILERPDQSKVTRVEAKFGYTGDLTGSTTVAYVMRYGTDGRGEYDGWERLEVDPGGPGAGDILLRHVGTFDPEGVDVRVASVPGSGLGSLARTSLRFTTRLTGHGPYPLRIDRGSE